MFGFLLCSLYVFILFFFFFFKQKTAYEMRISDWSSDVCSSDLRHDESFDALWFGRSPGAACSLRIGSGRALRRARLRRVEGTADRAEGGPRAQRRGLYRDFSELYRL